MTSYDRQPDHHVYLTLRNLKLGVGLFLHRYLCRFALAPALLLLLLLSWALFFTVLEISCSAFYITFAFFTEIQFDDIVVERRTYEK